MMIHRSFGDGLKHAVGEFYPCRAVRLTIPGEGRNMSVVILESREGLAIMGDFCPGQNGVCSALGYQLEWLAGATSPSYLAEKFLRKGFDDDIAKDAIKAWANVPETKVPNGYTRDEFIADALSRLERSREGVCHWLYDECDWESEDLPGWGYKPRDVGILVEIQEAFARVWPSLKDSASQAEREGAEMTNEGESR